MGLKDAIGRVLGGIGNFENTARFGEGYRERADMLARVNEEELRIKALTESRMRQEQEHAAQEMNVQRIRQAIELAPILARVQPREVRGDGAAVIAPGSKMPGVNLDVRRNMADLSKFVPGLDSDLAAQISAAGETAVNREDDKEEFRRALELRKTEDDIARATNYGQPTERDLAMWDRLDRRQEGRDRARAESRGYISPSNEERIISRLSGQWTKAAAPAAILDNQVRLMEVGLDAARSGKAAAGYQQVLVTFQKILDPPSVVRESEYNRSPEGLALKDRIKGSLEQLVRGGVGMPLEELEKFAQVARAAARAQTSGYLQAQKRRIGLTADRYGIPHELVFEDYDFGGAGSGDSPASGPSAAPAGEQVQEWTRGPDGKPVRKNGPPR